MDLRGAKSVLEERWLPVKNFEGAYSVSDMGRVRSETRRVVNSPSLGTRQVRARVLKPRPDGSGYLTLWLSKENTRYPVKVAHLVAVAFIGPNPGGLDVCHDDGDVENNAAANLKYGTRKQNMADCRRHGTLAQGERQGSAKLTEAKVRQILADPRTYEKIAADFGLSIGHVGNIKVRKAWKHIT